MNGSNVPKVASNCSTINGGLGAVAAVEFELVYGSNVPFAAVNINK